MSRVPRRTALACGALAALVAAGGAAQQQSVYRYTDEKGNVVYSDKAPPTSAKNVEAKRLTPNYIETDENAMTAQKARDRYPVTLYTFACGDICDRAEALLNRRGVPYTMVDVNEPEGQERLKKLTGELRAPVLQAGDTLVFKGFGEAEWQDLLDRAGYPKAPSTRRGTPVAPPSGAPKQAAAPAKGAAAPTNEPPGGGYPKN